MTTSKEISTVQENPVITVDTIKLKKLAIIPTFSDTAKVDKLVAKFGAEALSVVPDMSSKKSRDVIKSMAFKVSQTKTGVIAQMIKPSIEQAKKVIAEVGKGKAHFETKMNALRDEVRKPLNEWEAAEAIKEGKRISDIQEKIARISAIVTFDHNNPPGKDEITSLMEAVDSINCEEGFAEFTQDALQAKSKAKEALTERLNSIVQQEIKEAAEEELRLKELEIEKQQIKQQAQERVNKLMMIPVGFFGKSSHDIRKKITSLENYEVKEAEFGELTEQAKSSVINVVAQLNGMLLQQILVEDAVKVKQEEVEQAPFVEPEVKQEEPVQEHNIGLAPAAKQGETITKTIGGFKTVEKLTPHEQMIKDVRFWASEYGVINSELSDLMSILNKYK